MQKEVYPINKEHFIKLKKFAKKIIILCKDEKLNPVIYGSFMLFYYLKDKKLKVNDIDFYIKEKYFLKLMDILNKNQIKYIHSPEWHTLQIFNGNLKVEFDSINFWYKGPKDFINIKLEGVGVKALSLNALKSIYKKASEKSKDNSEGNRKKYEALMK